MGVVYEAEQLSIGRRVALKVLPFAAMLDPKQLQRFKNEVHAAGQLHHTNIVPIYAVGCERGVHFFAMQFIEGQTLAQAIVQRRQIDATSAAPASADTVVQGPATSTAWSGADAGSFRTVAQVGIQAAEALAHAHELGIIHRDIKPANLMLDDQGHLWVTDFGLAHVHGGETLTLSGDLVGTLRYMSPEQAMAKRAVIDHRTDIYSLGATLYELLTLEPAFTGRDRHELLKQIANDEPRRPRQLNRALPIDLETIVCKAMAKTPSERYESAQALADDLRRFVEDRAILARRPTLLQHARRWSRRHRPLVWSAAICLAVIAAAAAWSLVDRGVRRAVLAREVGQALVDSKESCRQERMPEAVAAMQRAEGLMVSGGGSTKTVENEVRQWRSELDFALRLESIRTEREAIKDENPDWAWADATYRDEFFRRGWELEKLGVDQFAQRVARSPIRASLIAALEDWHHTKWVAGRPGAKELAALLRKANPNPWREQLIEALQKRDSPRLTEVVRSEQARFQPPAAIVNAAQSLEYQGQAQLAVELLLQCHEEHPDDFWINIALSRQLERRRPPRFDEAIGYCRAALALRPGNPGVLVNLGGLLKRSGRSADAIPVLRRAISLKSDYATAHRQLGNALRLSGNPEEAVAELRMAMSQRPDDGAMHNDLAIVLLDLGQEEAAIAEYRQAIDLNANLPEPHHNLATIWRNQGKFEEAIAGYRRALAIKPNYAYAHRNLGITLRRQGKPEEALSALRRALALQPDDPESHTEIGNALIAQGKRDEALTAFQRALTIRSNYADAFVGVGVCLHESGRLDKAIAAYRRAIELAPKLADAHYKLANTLYDQGLLDEAVVSYRTTIELRPNDVFAHNNLGNVLEKLGQTEEAESEFRRTIELSPDHAGAHVNLGMLFDSRGESQAALAEIRQALALQPEFSDAHYCLGKVLTNLGQIDEAIAAYRQTIALKPEHAEGHCNLGQLLANRGEFDDALRLLKRGHEIGSQRPKWRYASAQWVRECERLIELDARLPAVLAGSETLPNERQRCVFADLCYRKRHYEQSARFYEEALAENSALSEDLFAGYGYMAGRAAALAGIGAGVDASALSDEERASRRRMAREWLQADLKRQANSLESDPGSAAAVTSRLRMWLRDPGVRGIREEEELAKLPVDERESFVKFWNDVRELLSRARTE